MKNDFHRRLVKEEEKKGKIKKYSDINVGDIIAGGITGEFYEVRKLLKNKEFEVINLTLDSKLERTGNFGRGHYEKTIYSANSELVNAEDF